MGRRRRLSQPLIPVPCRLGFGSGPVSGWGPGRASDPRRLSPEALRSAGRRMGTGGSAGVEYLDQTALAYRIFRDLWTVRTLQIPRDAATALEHASFYEFRAGG